MTHTSICKVARSQMQRCFQQIAALGSEVPATVFRQQAFLRAIEAGDIISQATRRSQDPIDFSAPLIDLALSPVIAPPANTPHDYDALKRYLGGTYVLDPVLEDGLSILDTRAERLGFNSVFGANKARQASELLTLSRNWFRRACKL